MLSASKSEFSDREAGTAGNPNCFSGTHEIQGEHELACHSLSVSFIAFLLMVESDLTFLKQSPLPAILVYHAKQSTAIPIGQFRQAMAAYLLCCSPIFR